MNDTVLSLFHIVCQPQYETWNCLVYSLSLSCVLFFICTMRPKQRILRYQQRRNGVIMLT